MKPLIALLLVSCGCIGAEPAAGPEPAAGGPPAITEPIVPAIEPPKTPAAADAEESDTSGKSPGGNLLSAPRISEFQNDEIGLVLRTLARQAHVSVLIDSSVTSTVTMRIDNKTPRETLEAVCAAKNLVVEEQKGVLVIRSRNPPPDNSLLTGAVVLYAFLAVAGWFTAGMLYQRLRSSAAGKAGPL